MAYLYVEVLSVDETRDRETGELRIAASCREVQPRTFTVNLSRQNAEVINRFNALRGQKAMVPLREGEFNGRPFFALEKGDIIPVGNEAQPVAPVSLVGDALNDNPEPPKKTGFLGKN